MRYTYITMPYEIAYEQQHSMQHELECSLARREARRRRNRSFIARLIERWKNENTISKSDAELE